MARQGEPSHQGSTRAAMSCERQILGWGEQGGPLRRARTPTTSLPACSGTTFVYTLVNRPYSPRKLRHGATETNVDNQVKRPSFRRACHVNTRQPVLSPWFQSTGEARFRSGAPIRGIQVLDATPPPCAMSSCSSDLQSAAATGTTTAAPIASRTERNKSPIVTGRAARPEQGVTDGQHQRSIFFA
ncbi:hypothetical protein ACCO45_006647 [Purpureocillium lilacinum]|uniref:Uncharacterized protein n=1 Tax=Purpureocillium lilacinum TaxID=33203 RepID=A0ACC4DQ30_PURLI